MNEKRTNIPTLPPVRHDHKDSVFRMLFNDAENLLSLYNALNGTNYEDTDLLEVKTLDNAIFLSVRNDVSCLISNDLSLYEHQSTVNPNMPLRYLLYVTEHLRLMLGARDLFKRRLHRIPTPRFVILYNGEEPQDDVVEYRLSDSFLNPTEEPQLELKAVQYNINPGHNEELLAACTTLREYMQYVQKIRKYMEVHKDLNVAVSMAVEACIREGILAEFLRNHQSEVVTMSIYEYDIESYGRDQFEEGREEGRELERKRAEKAEARAEAAEAEIARLKEQLAKLQK